MKASCGCGCECGCGHAHVHDHADGHAHNHDHDGKSGKRELMEIGAAACIFAVACIFKGRYSVLDFLLFFSSYLILGGEILIKAGRNLVKGEIFDENFLMSIATLAAFATGDFAEAVGVMLFFRIGEWFEHLASDRSRSRIMEAVDLRPETVRIADDNGVRTIPAAEANPGDILVVKAGDRIPLDAIVTEGVSRIDTSAVTGEPVPVKVGPGDAVTSGCVNMSGVLKVKVEKVLEDSMVTRILHSVENAAAGKPKIDRFITKFSRVYTPAVVAIAILTAIVPPLFLGNFQKWIYTAITFLVISCPCALVLSIPLTFFAGIGAGAKKGILFKDGRAIESLSRISAVVLDKTGTVTKGE